jgi:hypothetical protein
MIYKVFQQNMENVLIRRQENYIHLVFVSFYFLNEYKMIYFSFLIDALANIIKSCIDRLNDLSEKQAKFFCGFTLLKYCAVHLGLGHIPQHFDD